MNIHETYAAAFPLGHPGSDLSSLNAALHAVLSAEPKGRAFGPMKT